MAKLIILNKTLILNELMNNEAYDFLVDSIS